MGSGVPSRHGSGHSRIRPVSSSMVLNDIGRPPAALAFGGLGLGPEDVRVNARVRVYQNT